jgi:hypothetical protein
MRRLHICEGREYGTKRLRQEQFSFSFSIARKQAQTNQFLFVFSSMFFFHFLVGKTMNDLIISFAREPGQTTHLVYLCIDHVNQEIYMQVFKLFSLLLSNLSLQKIMDPFDPTPYKFTKKGMPL